MEAKAQVFKALCDEKRLRILKLLQGGEKCACVLIEALQIGQSALSYHMKVLCESKIVIGRQEGKWIFYKMSKEGVERAHKFLGEVTMQLGENC